MEHLFHKKLKYFYKPLFLHKNKMMLLKLDLIEGYVVKRPSRHVKTPYVADVLVGDQQKEILAHAPSLGCCGLADASAVVLMEANNKAGNKCSHTICLSIRDTQIIGINPKLAEQLVESALTKNCLSSLRNVCKYARETVIRVEGHVDSRFDFTGIDEQGRTFIMEVKVVPLAEYEDMPAKERAKMDFSGRDPSTKVAYFPEGYRKKAGDTVSPRALKHIRELTWIKRETTVRTIMCYVIQRTDVNRFQPSVNDPEYRAAFYEAREAGVEVITLVVQWTRDGAAYFVRDDLPIVGDL
jgi:DNA-binding sugar fermentation-stimulating protein